ncbi:ubiquitin-like small modifier protein 1 [Halobellus captivus]|uniref:ubiquitin-like small modifier protein 1 n=1 Tax=Halobellus captivus TaxID=2592614 RepID=UPI0011A1EA8E|nr:ubiquitin-like small modifier protein 1 [Halobellus captivus]
MHTVTWRLFADLAEIAGGREHSVDVDPDGTVGDALDALVAACDGLDDRILDDGALADDVNLMQNGTPASPDSKLEDGDELAMFPPVTGG